MSARFILNVRLPVPSSEADASRMSSAGLFTPDTGTTGYTASPAGSVVQLPGGRPCVPTSETLVPLTVADEIAAFEVAEVKSGWLARRLGPVRSRATITYDLPLLLAG